MIAFLKKLPLALILCVVAFAGSAHAADAAKDVERLMPPRTAVCFFEGEKVADMVLNARGKLTFVCVDGTMTDALTRLRKAEYQHGGSSGVPQQMFAYATKSRKKHVLFVARVQALKGWTFDPSLITVGGYSPSKEDIITGVSPDPSSELKYGERELAKGYDGFVGFFVPVENAKPGEATYVGYASDRSDFTVPGKD